MSIGETTTIKGTEYTAVAYNGIPSDFRPITDDTDPQCKLCALMPNYCRLMDDCHGTPPFIMVKARFVRAMAAAF